MISICIPSYNRPVELIRLLNTIKSQIADFEIVISEDKSPKRGEIEQAVERFKAENPTLSITLNLNELNLGYDGNFKQLIRLSKGTHCLFMGDDDLMEEGALQKVQSVLLQYPDLGFILRSWEEVDLDGNSIFVQKYYPEDHFFIPSEETVISFFRKSVFISGLVVHRDTALTYETDKVDGKLLYQIYLLSNILLDKPGYYIADIITKRVKGAEHFFGSSENEKGKFAPKQLTIDHSLTFMQGFIDIAQLVDESRGVKIREKVLIDFSKYSYGFLGIQREKGVRYFLKYAKKLAKMGFNRTAHFNFYVIMLSILGDKNSDATISLIKRNLKSIPRL